jgi:hypothetical protein
MKKLLFLLLAMTFFSCKQPKQNVQEKKPDFEIGDLVYIKPDSTKAMVSNVEKSLFPRYVTVDYKDSLGVIHTIVLNKKLLIKQ